MSLYPRDLAGVEGPYVHDTIVVFIRLVVIVNESRREVKYAGEKSRNIK